MKIQREGQRTYLLVLFYVVVGIPVSAESPRLSPGGQIPAPAPASVARYRHLEASRLQTSKIIITVLAFSPACLGTTAFSLFTNAQH